MRSISQQLKECCAGTDEHLGFNLNCLLLDRFVEIEINNPYPTTDELTYSRYDKNHTFSINGIDYSKDNLPEDLIEKATNRVHKINVQTLHHLCISNYINYIDTVNLIEEENITTGNFLNDFERHYTQLRKTLDNELRVNYRRYWREIILNNIYAIKSNNNSFSAAINNKAKTILIKSLQALVDMLTAIE